MGNDASPVFTFSTSETADTSCSLVLATAADSFAPCTSPQAYTDLPDGRYRFAVKAVDPAGNTGPVVTRTFTVDTKAPTVRVTGKPAAVTYDNTPTFTVQHGGRGAPAVLAAAVRGARRLRLVHVAGHVRPPGRRDVHLRGDRHRRRRQHQRTGPVHLPVDTLAPTATPKSPAAGATAVEPEGERDRPAQ